MQLNFWCSNKRKTALFLPLSQQQQIHVVEEHGNESRHYALKYFRYQHAKYMYTYIYALRRERAYIHSYIVMPHQARTEPQQITEIKLTHCLRSSNASRIHPPAGLHLSQAQFACGSGCVCPHSGFNAMRWRTQLGSSFKHIGN